MVIEIIKAWIIAKISLAIVYIGLSILISWYTSTLGVFGVIMSAFIESLTENILFIIIVTVVAGIVYDRLYEAIMRRRISTVGAIQLTMIPSMIMFIASVDDLGIALLLDLAVFYFIFTSLR